MPRANPAAPDAPIVGTIVQVEWTNDDRRTRFRNQYYRVMYTNEHGLLLSPDETAPLAIVTEPDGRPMYPDARPIMLWLANDGDTSYLTNVGVDLGFFDARPGTPVLDPDTGEYWPIEEFFPAYFEEFLENAIPLNLLSPDFAQEILTGRFQNESVIIIERCQEPGLTTFVGEPLKVVALTQTGMLCVPHAGTRAFCGVFVPFNGIAIQPAPVGSYQFSHLIGGDRVIYGGQQLAVEAFYPDVLGVPFSGPTAVTHVVEEQVISYEPGYVIEEYVPYWSPHVSVGIGFGFDVILY